MDQIPLVNEQIQDGKRFLERLAEEGVTITAACWLKESDGGWYLYIASSLVGESGGTKLAYQRILALFDEMPQPFWVDRFDIKAVEAAGPLSKAVQQRIRARNGRLPIWLDSGSIGCIPIDGGYVYPPIAAPVAKE
jgi:hypothetical protein